MTLDKHCFTEICEECGTAFSLKIKGKLHEEQTPYQRIEIFDTETFGHLMAIDGFTMVSERDNFIYHEMMTHPALFTHKAPEEILIIGGGDCGSLREVLKHPGVRHVVQIDIDERVTRLSEQYFPTLCESNNDPRAELKFIDGIQWVANTDSESVDVIIIDSTDPVGQAARLFSTDFYSDCHRILKPGGILIAQSESPLLHAELIKSMRTNMNDAGFTDLNTLHFPLCIYPTGWWSATMAGKGISFDTFREDDAKGKTFETDYYTEEVHKGAMALPPFVEKIILSSFPRKRESRK